MKTTLGRGTWAILVVLDAGISCLAVLFLGVQVAPCLGGVGPTGDEMRRRCAEAWFASRPLVEQVMSSPVAGIILFAALVLVTAWLTRDRGPRERQPTERGRKAGGWGPS